MAVWAAPIWQKRTPEQRKGLRDSLAKGNTIKWYMERMGQGAGRRYNHNYDDDPQERKPMHTNPRQGCPLCQQMLGTGSFQPHRQP